MRHKHGTTIGSKIKVIGLISAASCFFSPTNSQVFRLIFPACVAMAPPKHKRTHPQILSNIPLHKDSVVTRIEVSRTSKKRIFAKLSEVSVPVTKPAPSQDLPLQTPEPNDTEPPIKKARKKVLVIQPRYFFSVSI